MNKKQYLAASRRDQENYANSIILKIQDQPDLAEGMLVRIAPWCKNKWRIAHVVEVCSWSVRDCKIPYVDKEGLAEEPTRAIRENLIIL